VRNRGGILTERQRVAVIRVVILVTFLVSVVLTLTGCAHGTVGVLQRTPKPSGGTLDSLLCEGNEAKAETYLVAMGLNTAAVIEKVQEAKDRIKGRKDCCPLGPVCVVEGGVR